MGERDYSETGLRLAAQYEVARLLSDATEPALVLPAILASVVNNLRWDFAGLWQVDGAEIRCRHFHIRNGVDLKNFTRATVECAFVIGQGLPGRAWVTRRIVWMPHIESDENFPRKPAAIADKITCGAAVPIRILNEVFGVLDVFGRRARAESDAHLETLESIGAQLGQFLLRKQQETRLKESEEMHRMITQTAPDGIVIIDENSTILSVNPAMERIFGYAPSEFVGRSLTMLMPDNMAAKHRAGIRRYASTGQKNIPWSGLVLPGKTKDGRILKLNIAFGETVFGGHPKFIGFIRDVTNEVI